MPRRGRSKNAVAKNAAQASDAAPGIIRGTIRPSSYKVTRTYALLDDASRRELKVLRRKLGLSDACLFYLLYEHDLACLISRQEIDSANASSKHVIGALALLEVFALAMEAVALMLVVTVVFVVACVLFPMGRFNAYAMELRCVRRRLRSESGAIEARELVARMASPVSKACEDINSEM